MVVCVQRNSLWSPKSVPGVQAQPWKYNYQDGECGIHKTNDNYEAQDPKLELNRVRRTSVSVGREKPCLMWC